MKKTLLISTAIILSGILIGTGVFFGLKFQNAPEQIVKGAETTNQATEKIPPKPQQQTVTTSIDDDPILGNRETASVAIVEFSDYECSYCKSFKDQTLPQIKTDYIDTGKAILVFRDFPLNFHNPVAKKEALAAECVQEQGGDTKYYEYHDKIFETTPGNGIGIDDATLQAMAQEIGLDGNKLKECLSNNDLKIEITKDTAEAAKLGIRGTPGFVIGKLSEDGSVEGTIISGAASYTTFESAIEEYLK